MKLLDIKPNTVKRVFTSLAGHSKATENAILTACKYAVFFSLKDNNRERANQILPVVSKRYESIVKKYILTFASLEWDNEKNEFATLDGFVAPVGAEAIEEHKQKTLEFVSNLPDFDSLPKVPKAPKTLESGDAQKAIKNTLLRLTRLLKDQAMEDPTVLNEAKIIHALDSYMNLIVNGVSLDDCTWSDRLTNPEITPIEDTPAEVTPVGPRVFSKTKPA